MQHCSRAALTCSPLVVLCLSQSLLTTPIYGVISALKLFRPKVGCLPCTSCEITHSRSVSSPSKVLAVACPLSSGLSEHASSRQLHLCLRASRVHTHMQLAFLCARLLHQAASKDFLLILTEHYKFAVLEFSTTGGRAAQTFLEAYQAAAECSVLLAPGSSKQLMVQVHVHLFLLHWAGMYSRAT